MDVKKRIKRKIFNERKELTQIQLPGQEGLCKMIFLIKYLDLVIILAILESILFLVDLSISVYPASVILVMRRKQDWRDIH